MNALRGNGNQYFPNLAFKALEYLLHLAAVVFKAIIDLFCVVLFIVVPFYFLEHKLSADQWTRRMKI